MSWWVVVVGVVEMRFESWWEGICHRSPPHSNKPPHPNPLSSPPPTLPPTYPHPQPTLTPNPLSPPTHPPPQPTQDPIGKPVPCKSHDNGDATYVITYTPDEVGMYVVAVKYGGNHVTHSPFNVHTSPAGDAGKCRILGEWVG